MIGALPFTELAGFWAVAGLLAGSAYFAALYRTVDLFGSERGRLVLAAFTLSRLAAVVVFLGFAVHFGAVPLLAAFAGFLGARTLAMRLLRRGA